MNPSLGAEQKYSLITRRLEHQNGWGSQELQSLLTNGKEIKYQWVTAPTGKPHIGYFIPMIKFADFVRAGGQVVVEYIDTYAFLVNYKFPWDQVQHRAKYYKTLITACLESVGVPMSKVSMTESTSYQGDPKFMVDFWKLCALCSQKDSQQTGSEVGASTMLSPLLTPLIQELGEEYLDVDVELGGTDQRGIFDLGERFLPELGYKRRIHLMNELLPSLTGGKMSSSSPAHTKIMFLDDPLTVGRKISGASCPERTVQGNGVLPIVQHILMPVGELRLACGGTGESPFAGVEAPSGTLLSIDGRHYCDYEALVQDYVSGMIGPLQLKASVIAGLNHLLQPIRQSYDDDEAWKAADRMGYPEDRPTKAFNGV